MVVRILLSLLTTSPSPPPALSLFKVITSLWSVFLLLLFIKVVNSGSAATATVAALLLAYSSGSADTFG